MKKWLSSLAKSWKTTSAGIVAIVGGIAMWNTDKKAAMVAILSGIGMILAKDSNVSLRGVWVVKDENTGLYLVGYTENPLTPIWGAESAALEFEEIPAKVLAGRIGPGVIGVVKP